ncbi:MAG: WD40 repeat domain-containing protein, partial [Planctomycetota bacterium]
GTAESLPCLALTPDATKVIAAGAAGVVHIWNTADAAELMTINHGAPIAALHCSPDGTKLATGGDDDTVRVWDLVTGNELQYFSGHEAAVTGVRFGSDNRTLTSVGEDKSARVWMLSAVWAGAAHDGAVHDLELQTGGAQVATCGADGRIAVWNSANGQLAREIEAETESLSIVIRPDNSRLAAGGADGVVRVFNFGNGAPLFELPGNESVSALAYSPDNQKLGVCAAQSLTVYGPPVPAQQGVELARHQSIVADSELTDLHFASDNRRMFVSDIDGRLSEWTYAMPGPVRQFNHGGSVFGVAINGDGTTIVSCSADQTVRVWNAETGQQRAQLNGHQGPVYAIALSGDAALALSAGADSTLRLWDIAGGRQLKQLPAGDGNVYSIAINPEGTLFATAGSDRTVRIYDLLTGEEQRAMTGHSDFIHSVAFSPAGNRLLSYGYAGNLIVWNPADGAQVYGGEVGRVGNYAAWSPDGTRVVVANGNGTAEIADLPPEAR